MWSASNERPITLGVFLVIVTLALYAPVINQSFVRYDDGSYIRDNPIVNQGISKHSLGQAFSTLHADTSYWHPLTWISHQLDVELFHFEAGWHKLTNVIFHCYNTLLLFSLLRRFPQSNLACAIIAGLFAWHPLHVESVVWVSERKDVTSTFFALFTLHLYFNYAKNRSLKAYLFVMISFAFALMCKPMVVTLPLLMLLLDFWPIRHRSLGGKAWTSATQLLREKVPLLAMSTGVAITTIVAQRDLGIVPSITDLPISYRLANALESYSIYLLKMLQPTGLAVHYPYPESFSLWSVFAALTFFIGMSTTAAKCYCSSPYFTFGWAWYVISLLPVIGIFQTSNQARADRYTYLPLLGIFIILIWWTDQRVNRHRRVIFGGLLALATTVYIPLTWCQIGYWQNSEVLFRRAIAVTEMNTRMQLALGNTLSWESQTTEVIAHFNKAVRDRPASAEVYESLARYYGKQQDLRREIIHLRKSLLWDPEQSSLLNRLAFILATHPDKRVRNAQEAVELSRRACVLDGYKTALYKHTWAAAKAASQDFDAAIRISEDALAAGVTPQAAQFRNRLALYRKALPYRDPNLPLRRAY